MHCNKIISLLLTANDALTAFCISYKVAIPVERIIGLFVFAIAEIKAIMPQADPHLNPGPGHDHADESSEHSGGAS